MISRGKSKKLVIMCDTQWSRSLNKVNIISTLKLLIEYTKHSERRVRPL